MHAGHTPVVLVCVSLIFMILVWKAVACSPTWNIPEQVKGMSF